MIKISGLPNASSRGIHFLISENGGLYIKKVLKKVYTLKLITHLQAILVTPCALAHSNVASSNTSRLSCTRLSPSSSKTAFTFPSYQAGSQRISSSVNKNLTSSQVPLVVYQLSDSGVSNWKPFASLDSNSTKP